MITGCVGGGPPRRARAHWELGPSRLEAVRRHLEEIAQQWDRALRATVEHD